MTTIGTSNMFYLGNLAGTDPNESNFNSEDANAILGTYNKPPYTAITTVDQDDNGSIRDDEDNPAGDFINYDVGGGAISQFVDGTVHYNADVLLGDGTTLSIILLVIQTQNGDVFASDLTGNDELENQNIQEITLTSVNQNGFGGFLTTTTVNGAATVCFCLGTRIATPDGDVPVEALQVGDLVLTVDRGPQPIIWMNQRTLLYPDRYAPITFAPGSLGAGAPAKTLRLSPQHRLLLRSKIAQRVCGQSEVLIAAKDLLALDRVNQALPFLPTTYYHFACQHHAVVYANGAEAETFLLGPMSIKMLAPSAHDALRACNPETSPARPIVRGPKARALVRRHMANARPISSIIC